MKKLVLSSAVALACAALAVPTFAPAQPAGGGRNTDTTGYCLSEGFYGNEPNQADGSPGGPSEQPRGGNARGGVVPSQSPGPFVTDPQTGEVSRGRSIGQFNRDFDEEMEAAGYKNVAQVCHDYPDVFD